MWSTLHNPVSTPCFKRLNGLQFRHDPHKPDPGQTRVYFCWYLLWSFLWPRPAPTLALGVTGIIAWLMAFSQLWPTLSPTPDETSTGQWCGEPLSSPTKYTMLAVMSSKQWGLLPGGRLLRSCAGFTCRISDRGISCEGEWRRQSWLCAWCWRTLSFQSLISADERNRPSYKQSLSIWLRQELCLWSHLSILCSAKFPDTSHFSHTVPLWLKTGCAPKRWHLTARKEQSEGREVCGNLPRSSSKLCFEMKVNSNKMKAGAELKEWIEEKQLNGPEVTNVEEALSLWLIFGDNRFITSTYTNLTQIKTKLKQVDTLKPVLCSRIFAADVKKQ